MNTTVQRRIGSVAAHTPFRSFVDFTARILLGALFLVTGFTKVVDYEATQGYMTSVGVTGALLPVVIVLEVLGAAALIIGLNTRMAAYLLAGFSLLAAVMFHSNLGDQQQLLHFLKNLSIAGGLLLLATNGPGPISLDRLRR